jgi:hypothetical protein
MNLHENFPGITILASNKYSHGGFSAGGTAIHQSATVEDVISVLLSHRRAA